METARVDALREYPSTARTADESLPVVVLVTNIVPHYRVSFYRKLAQDERYQSILVHATSLPGDPYPVFKGELGIPNQPVRYRQWLVGPLTLRWQSGILRILHELRPRVVILLGVSGSISNWLAMTWARLHRTPVVIWACGWEPQVGRPLVRRLKHFFARFYFRSASRCLVYSTKGKRYIETLGVPSNRIRVCYNGLDIADLLKEEPRIRARAQALRQREAPGKRVVFLFVGTMIPGKKLGLLLEAYRRLESKHSDCALWLVGDGPERDANERLTERLGIQSARYFGKIIDDVDIYFAAADYFVLPGLGGLAFNQAMFWGTPCIGSEADGTEEDLILHGETGMRFVPDDAGSLAVALQACASLPPETREAWSRECKRIILERSNVDAMIATFKGTIAELLAERA